MQQQQQQEKKTEKKFFVFEVIVSELVGLNCLYQAGNACHRPSVR